MSRIGRGFPIQPFVSEIPLSALTKVRTSIGSGTTHSETVTINSVSGIGPYVVTLSASVPASVVIGDALYDENATPDKWRIIAISGSDITVVDSTGVGAAPDDTSASSTPVIERYYNGATSLTDWEAELDDTDLYINTGGAVGECYNDAVFDEIVNINGGATVGLSSITLTVASAERHNGTEGTGVVLEISAGNSYNIIADVVATVEWLEVHPERTGTASFSGGINMNDDATVQNCLVHENKSGSRSLINCPINDKTTLVQNNICYDSDVDGILIQNTNGISDANNNIVHSSDTIGLSISLGSPIQTIQNNLCTDNGTSDFWATADVSNTNMSSDATSPESGLRDVVSGDQYVSNSAPHDLHLKSGADAIGTGTDLSNNPTNVNIDIDGNDRQGMIGTDIGAHQFYEGFDSVRLSLGAGTTHNNTDGGVFTAVAGIGPYLLTLTTTPTVNVGDAYFDEHATPRKYRVIEVSGTSVSVIDSEATGEAPDNSGTTTPAVERYYNGSTPITDWEVDLDATNLYVSGDNAFGELYNDANFDEHVQLNGGATVGLASVTLTVPPLERHDGSAGTGSRFVMTVNARFINTLLVDNLTMEWFELDGGGFIHSGDTTGWINLNAGNNNTLKNVLLHDITGNANCTGISTIGSAEDVVVVNNIIYDITTNTSATDARGIYLNAGVNEQDCYNNTVFDVKQPAGAGTATGIASGSDLSNIHVKNNIAMGTDSTSGTTLDFDYAGTTVDDSNNLSSDDTADDGGGSGHLIDKTIDQFVSNSAPYDLHLKTGSDAIGAGTDLGLTPTGVNIDIDGNDRQGMVQNPGPDMGAHEYYEGFDKVRLSLGVGTTHNNTDGGVFTAVAGTGPYLLTLTTTPTVNVGDAYFDEHASPRKYRVIEVSGTSVSVIDSEATGAAPDNSGTTTPAVERYYNGSTPITDWEADLDDTGLYVSGDNASGECYNDAVFDEVSTVNGGATIGLSSAILTVPTDEQHNGTDGTGARIVRTGSGTILSKSTNAPSFALEWLEIDVNGQSATSVIAMSGTSGVGTNHVSNAIIHGSAGTSRFAISNTTRGMDVKNAIFYDFVTSTGTGTVLAFISGTAVLTRVFNCTCVGFTRTAGTVGSACIKVPDSVNSVVKNCIGMDNDGFGGTVDVDLYFNGGTNPDSETNLSSDASADDGGGSGHVLSVASGDQFVSNSAPFDLHLKFGADAIYAGTDLASSPVGVNIDIDGRDRNVASHTWDIGADAYGFDVYSIRRNQILGRLSLANSSFRQGLIGR